MNFGLILIFCILAAFAKQIYCAPVIGTDHTPSGIDGVTVENPTKEATHQGITNKEGAAKYLERYGYLKHGISKNSLSDELTESLKRMQKLFKLNVTGELDSETLALMNSKRCSLPDVVTSFGGRRKRFLAIRRWKSNVLSYRVDNRPSKVSRFDNVGKIDAAIDEGFQIWTKSANIFLTRSTDNSANIKLGFYKGDHGDNDPFYKYSTVLAHAFYPEDGRIHFNDDYMFSQYQDYNLRQIVAHEVGHAIGVGHSNDYYDVMYPFYYYLSNFTLSKDDIKGIQYLYGPPLLTTTIETSTKHKLFRNIPRRCRICKRYLPRDWCDLTLCSDYDY